MPRKPKAALPTWRQTPDGWTCDDPAELAFSIRAGLRGFDVRAFDRWLRELEPCAARDALLTWRGHAKRGDAQTMRLYLERMLERRFLIEREGFLLPLAAKGAKFHAGKPKGAGGPMRKLVRAMLAKKGHGELTARKLWEACRDHPESARRGIDFSDDDAFVAGHGNVTFARFQNIVSEEKRARKTPKLTE